MIKKFSKIVKISLLPAMFALTLSTSFSLISCSNIVNDTYIPLTSSFFTFSDDMTEIIAFKKENPKLKNYNTLRIPASINVLAPEIFNDCFTGSKQDSTFSIRKIVFVDRTSGSVLSIGKNFVSQTSLYLPRGVIFGQGSFDFGSQVFAASTKLDIGNISFNEATNISNHNNDISQRYFFSDSDCAFRNISIKGNINLTSTEDVAGDGAAIYFFSSSKGKLTIDGGLSVNGNIQVFSKCGSPYFLYGNELDFKNNVLLDGDILVKNGQYSHTARLLSSTTTNFNIDGDVQIGSIIEDTNISSISSASGSSRACFFRNYNKNATYISTGSSFFSTNSIFCNLKYQDGSSIVWIQPN